MKGQGKRVLKTIESRHTSQPDAVYFLPTTQFLKQFSSYITQIIKVSQSNISTEILSESA